MATHLQELLRSICWKSEWNYAVFWKFNHHTPMVLTWEDGYCKNNLKHDASDSKRSSSKVLRSLPNGEFAHDPLSVAMTKMSCHVYSLGEGIVGEVGVTGKHQWIFASDYAMCDEWQGQFSAGVKTIVVADVVPHGVVQLGSLNEVKEDFKLLTRIRELFSSLQESLPYLLQNPFFTSTRTFGPNALNENTPDLDRAMNSSNGTSFPGVHLSESIILYEKDRIPYDGKFSAENSQIGFTVEKKAHISIMPECCYSEAMDHQKSSLMFSGGSELHEALGPAFVNHHCRFSRVGEKFEERPASLMPEIMENSMLTSDYSSDNLLEAVVANFCCNNVNIESGVSFSTSESMLTTEKISEPYINGSRTIGYPGYSIGCSSLQEENKNDLKSSDSHSIRSSTTACRDTLVKSIGPCKGNKKRARPTENLRPRPRDRQLIQDRIKELRKLVPNGSKGSIDSLLERTVKHIVFMQSVTKHTDKLSNCAKSRGCSKEIGLLGSGYEQGSSWAVEVGDEMKICPILVENLNVNGQMLIEMLCEDRDNFMEIVQAIRNLGLTILKGITENHGDKTWMRFIVEGQSNKNLHRMDILWTLVQLLESRATS